MPIRGCGATVMFKPFVYLCYLRLDYWVETCTWYCYVLNCRCIHFPDVWVVHAELCVSQGKKLKPVCVEGFAFLYLGFWGGGRDADKSETVLQASNFRY